MRTFSLLYLIFHLVFTCINGFCQTDLSNSATIPEPPISYQPLAMGFNNEIMTRDSGKIVEILCMPFTASDSSSKKVDFIVGIVEVYDKRDSLLQRIVKSVNHDNKVSLNLRIIDCDSFYVRGWGFCYHIYNDRETPFDSKKALISSTPLNEFRYPPNKINKNNETVSK